MKIIIFGGSGFLGTNIAKVLLEKKFEVTIFDKKKNKLKNKNLKNIIADITDFKKVKNATKDKDYVFNLAGISDIEESIKKPKDSVKINIMGTLNTLEASREFKIKKYLFASSIYVLSGQGGFYRTSKKSCELYIEEYKKRFNQNFTIIRYGSVYGIDGDVRNGISKILYKAEKKNILEYGGTNKAVRKFIHVEDACKASVDLLQKKFDNKIVFILGKKSTKIKDLMKHLGKVLKIKRKPIYNNKIQLGHYDKTPFGYKPTKTLYYFRKSTISLNEGLKNLIKDIKIKD